MRNKPHICRAGDVWLVLSQARKDAWAFLTLGDAVAFLRQVHDYRFKGDVPANPVQPLFEVGPFVSAVFEPWQTMQAAIAHMNKRVDPDQAAPYPEREYQWIPTRTFQ